MQIQRLFAVAPLLDTATAATQLSTSSPGAAAMTDLKTIVEIVGIALTGLATLIGLPLASLTYRKTRAEITKLELEANALQAAQAQHSDRAQTQDGTINISITDSPSTNIQVLADPRFLAPLLILLDFIFVWIILSLAGHFLAIFGLGGILNASLAILAAALLLPIARQVLRVRAVLQPARTPEEIRASQKQARTAAYLSYLIVSLSVIGFGALLLAFVVPNLAVRRIAWGLVIFGGLLTALIPVVKRRFDRYLLAIYKADSNLTRDV